MAALNEETVQEVVTEIKEITMEEKEEKLSLLMADGKRELLAGNFEAAGQKFGEAAAFTSAQYGELAAEAFEPKFMSGRALFELAVNEKNKAEETKKDEKTEDTTQEEKKEDINTNQLARESYEVAAKIADKIIAEASSEEWKRKKADVFVHLAKCSINEEKYDVALEDLERGRNQLATLESAKGDRLVAEIYFHEGRIFRLRNEEAAAVTAFSKAVEAMETTLAGVKSASGDAPTDDQKQQIEELVEIIKDFKERAVDQTKKEEEAKEKQPAVLSQADENTDGPANDISSSLREKRVHDDSESDVPAKRSKSEEKEENIAA